MKRIFNTILHMSVIAGLLVFGLPFSSQSFAELSRPPMAAAGIVSQITVRVTAGSRTQTVAVAGSTNVLPEKCFFAIGQTRNLAQDTGLFNLNQPVSCFNLSLAPAKPLAKLEVKPLAAASQQIKILVLAPTIASVIFSRTADAAQLPILPVTAAVFAGVVAFFKKKEVKEVIARLKLNLPQPLTLQQLQMLRC